MYLTTNGKLAIFLSFILKEAGVKYISAKAGDKLHKDILEKLEIDEVVFPEEYIANLTAEKILNDDFNTK